MVLRSALVQSEQYGMSEAQLSRNLHDEATTAVQRERQANENLCAEAQRFAAHQQELRESALALANHEATVAAQALVEVSHGHEIHSQDALAAKSEIAHITLETTARIAAMRQELHQQRWAIELRYRQECYQNKEDCERQYMVRLADSLKTHEDTVARISTDRDIAERALVELRSATAHAADTTRNAYRAEQSTFRRMEESAFASAERNLRERFRMEMEQEQMRNPTPTPGEGWIRREQARAELERREQELRTSFGAELHTAKQREEHHVHFEANR